MKKFTMILNREAADVIIDLGKFEIQPGTTNEEVSKILTEDGKKQFFEFDEVNIVVSENHKICEC